MITVGELLDELTYVYLSQHNLGRTTEDSRQTQTKRKLVLINSGVRAIHTRLTLRRHVLQLTPIPERSVYTLDQSMEYTEYLSDATDRGILRLLGAYVVFDKNRKKYVPIDVEFSKHTEYTPDYVEIRRLESNVVEIPCMYQKPILFDYVPLPDYIAPAKGSISDCTDLAEFNSLKVDIPDTCVEALCLYISSKVMATLKGKLDQAPYNPYSKRYHDEMTRLKSLGLEILSSSNQIDNFLDRGFV